IVLVASFKCRAQRRARRPPIDALIAIAHTGPTQVGLIRALSEGKWRLTPSADGEAFQKLIRNFSLERGPEATSCGLHRRAAVDPFVARDFQRLGRLWFGVVEA